ncbi:hypothetical protein KAH81_06930, partial [bacterium]|nr:hypothetical protein [bacterium]
EYLYIGIHYSISENGVTCYLDCGSGGSFSFRAEDGWTGTWARDITSDRDIEIFMGAWNGGAFNIYSADENTSTSIDGECLSACSGSFDSEVGLPWTAVFPDGFPIGAEIAIATLLVGGDGYFAADAMPDQPTVGDGIGPDLLEVFETIIVDADSDGIPDFEGTFIGGTVYFSDITSPPFPLAQINAGEQSSISSQEDGSWQLTGLEVGDTIAVVSVESPGYWPSQIIDVQVTDPPNESLEVTLEPFTGAISGDVVPAMGCSLVATFSDTANPSAYSISSLCGIDGFFRLNRLSSGYWDVIAFPNSPDYAPTKIDSVLVEESETTTIEIILEAASILRQWGDAYGDDYGPGSYTYPTDNAFVDGSFDILGVIVKDFAEADEIEFEVELGDLAPEEIVDWAPYYPPLNTQKLDIYIDAHGGGSSQGLENRFASFVPTDYWDWAISVDGWWVGMFASNGQSIEDGYTQNITAVNVSVDTVNNKVKILIDKSAFIDHFGEANFDDFQYWDFIVLSLGHDGNGVSGVRWVNPGSASQWNFGGGADGDIDPNVIDMSISAGLDPISNEPKEPADPQQTQLDWNLGTPVELSAHRPVDITPPQISYDLTDSLQHLLNTLHLLIQADISDDIEVKRAFLHYSTGAQWDSIEMGSVEDGITWFGNIPVEEPIAVDSPLATSLSFFFTAIDSAGNLAFLPDNGDSLPPEYPFSVASDNPSRLISAPTTIDSFITVFDAGFSASDTLVFDTPSGDMVAITSSDLSNFPAVPATLVVKYPSFAGSQGNLAEISVVRREIRVSGAEALLPITLRLHWLAERLGQWEPERLSLTEFGGDIVIPRPYGGTYYSKAASISGNVKLGSGLWAVGRDLRGSETDAVLRNIRFSPNPFSPNGDGIYDEVEISWETGANGSMDIDVYSLTGQHISRLARDLPVRENNKGSIWWNGEKDIGSSTKAGIYAVRFELTYIDAGVELKIRENRPIVIIR